MSYNKFIKYQKSNSCYFFNKQYIGRRFGKEGPLQSLIKLEQDIGNRLANPGTDTVFSALPFLRFLPIPISFSFHEAKSVHQQILDTLETLSVHFKAFTNTIVHVGLIISKLKFFCSL